MRLLATIAVLIVSIAVSGCYVAEEQVITRSMATSVPNVTGTYFDLNEGLVTIEEDGANQYLVAFPDDGDTFMAAVRVMPMAPYLLVQLWDSTGAEPGVAYALVSIESGEIRIHLATPDISALAEEFGLSLRANRLEGPADGIIPFYQAFVDKVDQRHTILRRAD